MACKYEVEGLFPLPSDAQETVANRSSDVLDPFSHRRPGLRDRAGPPSIPGHAGVAGDFGRGRLALPERLSQPFEGDGSADRSAVAETVRDRLRHAEDARRDALDALGDDSVREERLGEPDDTHRRRARPGRPILRADRHPHRARQLVGEAMEGKRRDEADHLFRLALGRLRKAVIGADRRIGPLYNPRASRATSPSLAFLRRRGSPALARRAFIDPPPV